MIQPRHHASRTARRLGLHSGHGPAFRLDEKVHRGEVNGKMLHSASHQCDGQLTGSTGIRHGWENGKTEDERKRRFLMAPHRLRVLRYLLTEGGRECAAGKGGTPLAVAPFAGESPAESVLELGAAGEKGVGIGDVVPQDEAEPESRVVQFQTTPYPSVSSLRSRCFRTCASTSRTGRSSGSMAAKRSRIPRSLMS